MACVVDDKAVQNTFYVTQKVKIMLHLEIRKCVSIRYDMIDS